MGWERGSTLEGVCAKSGGGGRGCFASLQLGFVCAVEYPVMTPLERFSTTKFVVLFRKMAHATKLVTNIRVKCRESSSFYDQIFRCFFPLRCQVTLRKKLRNLCGVLNLLNVRIFAPLDVAHVRKSTNECRCAKPLYYVPLMFLI